MKKYLAILPLIVVAMGMLSISTYAGEESVVENGRNIKLNYEIKVNEEIVDTTAEDEPIAFKFGSDEVLPAFQDNVRGLKVGDKKSFILQPHEGYGQKDSAAVVGVKRSALPPEDIQVGAVLNKQMPTGEVLVARVIAMKGDDVTLDFNHPLAGEVLHFKVEIVEII